MLEIELFRQDSGMTDNQETKPLVCDKYYFCLMTTGKCIYKIDNEKVILEKGMGLLLPPGTSVYWKSIPTVFHAKFVTTFQTFLQGRSAMIPILQLNKPLVTRIGGYDRLHDRMKQVYELQTDKLPYYQQLSDAWLMEILIYWSMELDKGQLEDHKHNKAELLKRHIQVHYRRRLNKHELADVIRKSPNYTATLFRQVTGQTISEYVHSIRIKNAVYMLSESMLNIAEVSEFVGYNDVSYFNRIFKRITGKNPSDYTS